MRNWQVWWLVPLVVLTFSLSGCVSSFPPLGTSQVSPLQLRAIETRTYETRDTKTMLKAAMNVLQDEGFSVDYGNTELGILHAKKTFSDSAELAFNPTMAFRGQGRYQPSNVVVTLEATVNVSEFGARTKVRITFHQQFQLPSNFVGGVVTAGPLSDPKFYQEFFAALDRGVFIEGQGL